MASRPEKAFRIADSRPPIFDGTGAFLVGARWNSAGWRAIYAADSFAAAMLEMLVHTSGKLPSSHKWIEIEIPETVSVEILEGDRLPGWNHEDTGPARRFGDAWLKSKRSLILVAPSIVTDGLSRNIVINPDHAEFHKLKPSAPCDVVWDARLF